MLTDLEFRDDSSDSASSLIDDEAFPLFDKDTYDPLFPNDYGQAVEERWELSQRKQKEEQERMMRDYQEQSLRKQLEGRERIEAEKRQLLLNEQTPRKVEDDNEEWERKKAERAQRRQISAIPIHPPQSSSSLFDPSQSSSKAGLNLLQKMGYSGEGGLGKHEQGIETPLGVVNGPSGEQTVTLLPRS
ncbi:hypothetical protein BLNAU_610 [Blattamonas nauphoetae]|uniref:G-patch domain-containing protein n=1 Tax=Blattamonas nauphoetae TaxID=2049346 RepID=A0ABQ9YLQ5_9EUKA|nr:hypothetical protein BLNAU_610 [Blattamonas nauphoetae]